MFYSLIQEPLFLLFSIIAIGELLGKISVLSFSLGSAMIVFIGLLFGHYGFVIPKIFQTFGLALFIYSIGLQAGPGIISSWRSQGLKTSIATILIVFGGFLTTVIVGLAYGYDANTMAGIFSGALTSSPGLAVAIESSSNNSAASIYGITYIYGILAVILSVKLVPLILRKNIKSEEQLMKLIATESIEKIESTHLEINNPNVDGKSISEIDIQSIAPITITRLVRKDGNQPATLVRGSTKIYTGDKIRVVGSKSALAKMRIFLGKKVETEIDFKGDLIRKRIIVSRSKVVGKTIQALGIRDTFDVQVARISRNGIDLPADPSIRLHMNDIVTLVGREEAVKNLEKFMGNDIKSAYRPDMLTLIIGLCLGLIVGHINFSIPFLGSVSLGITGGALLSGLVLSYLHSTRNLVWDLPIPARDGLRQLGLMIFLATVGTNAGASLLSTFEKLGVDLLIGGVLVTSVSLIWAFFVCLYLLKIPFLGSLGTITGAVTSTPGLAAANSLSSTNHATSSYASVYPIALLSMIIFTKLLFLLPL